MRHNSLADSSADYSLNWGSFELDHPPKLQSFRRSAKKTIEALTQLGQGLDVLERSRLEQLTNQLAVQSVRCLVVARPDDLVRVFTRFISGLVDLQRHLNDLLLCDEALNRLLAAVEMLMAKVLVMAVRLRTQVSLECTTSDSLNLVADAMHPFKALRFRKKGLVPPPRRRKAQLQPT